MKKENSNCNFEHFSIREEKNDYLLFLNNSGKCFIINEKGKLIIELLKENVSMQDIVSRLNIDSHDLQTQLEFYEFVNKLISLKILLLDYASESRNSFFVIESLENSYSKGKQCVTFGMPKRSCKSLPSGIVEKNNQ